MQHSVLGANLPIWTLIFNLQKRINPSLNTQFCIKGLLVVRNFCFWAVWAAGQVHKKKVGGRFWATFWGRFFHVFYSVRTKKLHIKSFFANLRFVKLSAEFVKWPNWQFSALKNQFHIESKFVVKRCKFAIQSLSTKRMCCTTHYFIKFYFVEMLRILEKPRSSY